MVERYLDKVIYAIEVVVAAILVLLTALSVAALGVEVVRVVVADGLLLTPVRFTSVISVILEVFILIELFRIALAYMAHRNVIPTVLEAALVAIARKFVVFEPKGDYLAYAVGHAALLLAVAIAWWLLSRARACEMVADLGAE